MTQNIELDHGNPVHEGFFDPIQELLGASAASLNVTILNGTTLQVVAGSGNSQQAVAIQGRYRYRTSNTTAALPGGLSDGTHPVFVTAADNDFSGPETDPDQDTDYNFGLQILASGGSPSTDIYRQVGEVDVVGGAITAYRQIVGQRLRDGQPVYARPDHASTRGLVVKGLASQAGHLIEVLNNAGTQLLRVESDGDLVLGSGADVTLANDGTFVIGDVVLSRAAADALGIADEVRITKADQQLLLLSGDSGSEGQLAIGRTAAEAELVVEATAGETVTGSAVGDLILKNLTDGKAVWITGGTDGDVKVSDARVDITGVLANTGNIGFRGTTPAAAPDYTVNAGTSTDRTIQGSTTVDEIRNVLATVIADLIAQGIFQ